MASTRYAAWKPPWWVTVSGRGRRRGREERVLRRGVDRRPRPPTPAGRRRPAPARAPAARSAGRRSPGCTAERPSCSRISPRTARATRAAPGKGVARSTAGSTDSGLPRRPEPGQRGHRVRPRRASSRSASAPSAACARVNALLDISGSASAEVSCSRCRRPPVGAGPLAEQRQADLGAGREVAGAQAAVPVDDRQVSLRAAGQLGERDGEVGRGARAADQQLVGADRQGAAHDVRAAAARPTRRRGRAAAAGRGRPARW